MKDILIVEDNKTERERLERLAKQEGYSVSSFDAIEPARTFLRGQRVRLAILDIGLQDGSGSALFHEVRKDDRSDYVFIYTGNPSAHLKERFAAQGASQYIVKGSEQASDKSLRQQLRELLGEPSGERGSGMPLPQFLSSFVSEESREFFLDPEGQLPSCTACGSNEFTVLFSTKVQFPPDVHGVVTCSGCGAPMQGEVVDDE